MSKIYALLVFLLVTFKFSYGQAPVISSFNPASGNAGTTVTITGIGFNATAANNIVYFGPVRSTVNAVSSNSITVTVPLGATFDAISVLNLGNGLTCTSNKPFKPTFQSKRNIVLADFKSKTDISIATPWHVTTGDLDDDGKTDLVTANLSSNNISILKNASVQESSFSAASFAQKFNIPLGSSINLVRIGDIDGDGKKDIVALSSTANLIFVLKNNAAQGTLDVSSFGSPVTFTTSGNPEELIIGDVDNDGKPDLLTANLNNNNVSVYRNTTAIGAINTNSFAAAQNFATGIRPKNIALTDLNNDGYADMVVSNNGSRTVSVFQNNSSPSTLSFTTRFDLAVDNLPTNVAVSDMDGDGIPDITVLHQTSTIIVLKNNFTGSPLAGSFGTRASITTDYNNSSLSVSDIDGDEKPDLVISNNTANCIYVLRNITIPGTIGGSAFATAIKLTTAITPTAVATADFDNDGKQDLISASPNVSLLSLFKYSPILPPVVLSANPLIADGGTTVTITGKNFNTNPDKIVVYFGTVKAIVSSVAATQIKVTVPNSAPNAPINVTDIENRLSASTSVSFTLTHPSINRLTPPDFRPRVEYSTTVYGMSTSVTGDFDGDGKPDYAYVNGNTKQLNILRNTTLKDAKAASFAAPVIYAASNSSINVVDINSDGKLDLIVLGPYLTYYINKSTTGVLSFEKIEYNGYLSTNIIQSKFIDVNLDGKPDLVFVNKDNNSGSSIYLLRNICDANTTSDYFDRPYIIDLSPYEFFSVDLVDIDGDNKPELIAGNDYSILLAVFKNQSENSGTINGSTFAAPFYMQLGANEFLTTGDIDNDGKNDIIATQGNNNKILTVYRNKYLPGTPLSASAFDVFNYSVEATGKLLRIAELDGDGKPEIIFSNYANQSISILRNNTQSGVNLSANSFGSMINVPTDLDPYFLEIQDMNGDNKLDFIVSSGLNFSVILNDPLIYQPPIITSFSPEQTYSFGLVTINGQNFNSIKENNIVYFGGAKAKIISATAEQLVVEAPTGNTYEPISVLNIENRLSGYSAKPFHTTFTSKPEITISDFHPGQVFGGNTQKAIAMGDIDGDGKVDVVTGSSNASYAFSVYLNASSPKKIIYNEYDKFYSFSSDRGATAIALADIDLDGKLDVVFADSVTNTVTVYRNTSNGPGTISWGSYYMKYTFETGVGPRNLVLTDIDGDGKIDIVTSNATGNSISVLRNRSSPASFLFDAKKDFLVGTAPASLDAFDLDGDGKVDLVVPNEGNNTITLLKNTSTSTTISFGTAINLNVQTKPVAVKVGDLNNDKKPDLVVVNKESNSISILENTTATGSASATFGAPIHFTTGKSPAAVALFDLNGDGYLDLVTANTVENSIAVFRNAGSTQLSSTSLIGQVDFFANAPINVWISDYDNDGKADIITASAKGKYTIFRNDPVILSLKAVPVITAISPQKASVGAMITITGLNFNATPTNNIVSFGTINATVISASTTSITVKVPAGTSIEQITVLDKSTFRKGYAKNSFVTTFPSKNSFTSSDLAAQVDLVKNANGNFKTGDINGDGKQDFVVVNASTKSVTVYINKTKPGEIAEGSFESRFTAAIGEEPTQAEIADLNGDGKPDLAIINGWDGLISIFTNTSQNGNVSFAPKVDIMVDKGIKVFTIGDLDQDGRPDIVVGIKYEEYSSHYATRIRILQNYSENGIIDANSFTNTADFTATVMPSFIQISDIDGDSKPDIVVSSGYPSEKQIAIFKNTSITGRITPASFAAKLDLTSISSPVPLFVEDFDDDGKPDFVYSSIALIKNNHTAGILSTSSFNSSFNLPYTANPRIAVAALGDLDGDGKIDIIAPSSYTNTMAIFKNQSQIGILGSSSFKPNVDFQITMNSNTVCTDIDSDGKPDIMFKNGPAISILRNIGGLGTPVINSFTVAARTGDVVTIKGINFNGTTAVSFGGISATAFNVISNEEISAVVGTGATGFVTVTNTSGVVAKAGFEFISTAGIASFTPIKAAKGTSITITGSDFTNTSSVSFGGILASSFKVISPTIIEAEVNTGASGEVAITTPRGIYRKQGFNFIPAPVILSISPTAAVPGTTITITGTNFDETTAVSFGGKMAISFTFVSSTVITAIVGDGNSGNVEVTAGGGKGIFAGFTAVIPIPTIASFSPASGGPGRAITISGTNLLGTTSVLFGGVPATTFTINSSTRITAYAGLGISGDISVTTPYGTATQAGFTFIPLPTITSFNPVSAKAGAMITITGTALNGTTAVYFGNVAASSFTVVSPTTISAVVGNGTSGNVAVVTESGSFSKPGFNFIKPPFISSTSSSTGTTGSVITIYGLYFDDVTAISFGGVPATSFTVVSPSVINAVVGLGGSGSVSVTTLGGTGIQNGFNYIFSLPANNFNITTNNVICKGSSDGAINITALQNLNYTVKITGATVNTTNTFNTNFSVNNLPIGTYNICFTVAAFPSYQQCFTITVREPEDLKVYNAINPTERTVTLSLSGGNSYVIKVNGNSTTTTASSITLPLVSGNNTISVTTDKSCQGEYLDNINLSETINAYPNPFTNELNLAMGTRNIPKASVVIYNLINNVVYSKDFVNVAGNITLQLPSLPEGVYLLRLTTGTNSQTIKIIKK